MKTPQGKCGESNETEERLMQVSNLSLLSPSKSLTQSTLLLCVSFWRRL